MGRKSKTSARGGRNWPAVSMNDQDVRGEAQKIVVLYYGRYGLKNAKKIVAEVKRMLLAETKRRRDLK